MQQLTNLNNEGVQNEYPQDVSLQYVDYFELNIMEVQKTQEELFTSPSIT